MDTSHIQGTNTDQFTRDLLAQLLDEADKPLAPVRPEVRATVMKEHEAARQSKSTQSILNFFTHLFSLKENHGISPQTFGFSRQALEELAALHEKLDEHGVSLGGRLLKAAPIVSEANSRVTDYLAGKHDQAPSGIELDEQIEENRQRIMSVLSLSDNDWFSYSGQLRNAINGVDDLARVVDLPEKMIAEVLRVTKTYRMRLTPYYASLILPGKINDPVLIQAVPTAEMVDNIGEEIPPVASDHSPARLVDQFYPRVVTIKVTNMCAMYCTHCLRLAHIGRKDQVYSMNAYKDALAYIRQNKMVRDVLITGGDAFALPNAMIRTILAELDSIEHVKMKRLGTRIPVTVPMRIDDELLDILEHSNRLKPVRVVTQINTAQEITKLSRQMFYRLSERVSALLNQAVLLKGINDSSVKMWKLCETVQEAYVRPYYVFNCSYRNPQFNHLRVPVEKGRDIIEGMYGNISGDAIPRYIVTAGGKIPMHRDNVTGRKDNNLVLQKPWSGDKVLYPDADPVEYAKEDYGFNKPG